MTGVKGADAPPSCFCGRGEAFLKFGRWGHYWVCRDPGCEGMVGCHKDTALPRGKMSDKATRQARMRAHAAFDPLWKSLEDGYPRQILRKVAYAWLAEELGLDPEDAHIGYMNREQCERVVELCQQVTSDVLEERLEDEEF